MDDMTQSIEPKSDQLNAEDLLSGPRTVTITDVRVIESPDQPVSVYTAEFGRARPFKPSKTVRRLMVVAWGPDSAAYVGKRLTLYRDPEVKWAGMDVGGIRVSHMSGLDGPLNVALTVTRGRRAPYTVDPLPDEPAVERRQQPGPSLDTRVGRMIEGFARLGVTEEDIARRIGRPRAGWAEDDLTRMTDVFMAVRHGEQSREEAFPRSEVTADDLPPDPSASLPTVAAPTPPQQDTDPGRKGAELAMRAALADIGVRNRDDQLAVFSALADRPIRSAGELTADEVDLVAIAARNLVAIDDPEHRQAEIGAHIVDGHGHLKAPPAEG